jgi:hypothetical protein
MTRASFRFGHGKLLSAVAAAIMFGALPVSGQQQEATERPFSFGFGVGAAGRPGGGIGSLGLIVLEFEAPWRNASVRLDGSVTSWAGNISGGRVTSLTSNLVYSRQIGVFAPYVLGGVGGYAQSGVGASFGVNAGVGSKASLGRLQPFIELREHVWSADRTRRATPLTIGLMF